MIDLKQLEADPDAVVAALRRRGDVPNLDEVLALSKQRKAKIAQVQADQEKRNAVNAQMKGAAKEVIEERRAELRALGDGIKAGEAEVRDLEEKLSALALLVPNPPRKDVPDGSDEHGNVEVRRVLEPKAFDFAPKDHLDLGEALGIIDTARAAKISGARFAFLQGQGARLERALVSFMLDHHLGKGDREIAPPYLVSGKTLEGTGQLPKFADDLFGVSFGPPAQAGPTPLYLIPTAEVPLTNYFADEVVDEERLPIRFCAFSPCFRAEAGAAGKDTRGLVRQHQFDKVEMVRFCTPEQADAELEGMVERASAILAALELPHRVMLLCAGDMGFAAEKTYDLEVWLPAQGKYREISSCSTCGAFQARRAKIRSKPPGGGKPRPITTLNGSGLAVGRTLIAILENHQQADGSVRIPPALRPYLNGHDALRSDGAPNAP